MAACPLMSASRPMVESTLVGIGCRHTLSAYPCRHRLSAYPWSDLVGIGCRHTLARRRPGRSPSRKKRKVEERGGGDPAMRLYARTGCQIILGVEDGLVPRAAVCTEGQGKWWPWPRLSAYPCRHTPLVGIPYQFVVRVSGLSA